MNKINDDNHILKDLQLVELDILKAFISACEKCNVNYFLLGGTLIGAIRHKGFIPWDDDIDVCMFREDYEKFLKYGQSYMDKKYFLQTYITDEEYSGCFAKIRNSETTFLEKNVQNRKMNHGIYIDIFPLDNLYNHNKLKEKLLIYKLYNHVYVNDKNIIKRIIAIISNIIYKNNSKLELCIKLDKLYQKANNKKTKKIANYSGAWGVKKESHFREDFENFKIVDFEGINVKIPCGYDRCLRDTYGDYMQLPPKEKQITHHYTNIIDSKKSYKYYINR